MTTSFDVYGSILYSQSRTQGTYTFNYAIHCSSAYRVIGFSPDCTLHTGVCHVITELEVWWSCT